MHIFDQRQMCDFRLRIRCLYLFICVFLLQVAGRSLLKSHSVNHECKLYTGTRGHIYRTLWSREKGAGRRAPRAWLFIWAYVCLLFFVTNNIVTMFENFYLVIDVQVEKYWISLNTVIVFLDNNLCLFFSDGICFSCLRGFHPVIFNFCLTNAQHRISDVFFVYDLMMR